MRRRYLLLTVVIAFLFHASLLALDEPAFEGAEGFGALSKGGRDGKVLMVTTLDDHERAGSLRWAVSQEGPRIVRFQVAGTILLKSALSIRSPFLTIDGSDAMANGNVGITLRDYPIDIRTHDVVIRYLRVRLGDNAVLRRVQDNGWKRHEGSQDLDCINIDRSENVIIDHVTVSWSTDELISVTRSRNVTVQWCILAEPLSNATAHPYGDNHAYGSNNSASTVSYHHCLFAHYVMRGPQFEANDMDHERPYDAQFEAVNNVLYAYAKTGSRYRTGFEKDRDEIKYVGFAYHFIGNHYLNADPVRPEIEADDKFGVEENVRVYLQGNRGPHQPDPQGDQLLLVYTDSKAEHRIDSPRQTKARAQISGRPLFSPPIPVSVQTPEAATAAVLREAGCSLHRDVHDLRVVDEARKVAPTKILRSQEEVGGWKTWKK